MGRGVNEEIAEVIWEEENPDPQTYKAHRAKILKEMNIIECDKCGLEYSSDYPEEVRRHRKEHDLIVNGVRAVRAKSDCMIWEAGQFRITVVTHTSPRTQKKRAEKAARLAKRDTCFDFPAYHADETPDERDVHVFLLYYRSRIIGFLVFRKCTNVRKTRWDQLESNEPIRLCNHPPLWTVEMIWIHRFHRRKGLATQLLAQATSFLNTDLNSIGWYIPFTELGTELAKRLCPNYFYVCR